MNIKTKKLSHTPYEYADLIYRYAQLIINGAQFQLDYGTGELYTSVEVHTVTFIEEHPGITASEIAKHNQRTKGAVSQILAKIEKKGLIRREKDPNNARCWLLYVTPKGLKLSHKHKEYDSLNNGPLLENLISLFGYEAVEKFYEIMDYEVHSYQEQLQKFLSE